MILWVNVFSAEKWMKRCILQFWNFVAPEAEVSIIVKLRGCRFSRMYNLHLYHLFWKYVPSLMCVIYTTQNYLKIVNLASYVKITHQYTSFCCIHHIILLLLQIQHTRKFHYIIICCVAKCKLTETFHIIVLALIQTFFELSCLSFSNLFRCFIRIVFE